MTRTMRTVHKWVALVLALQFVAWMISGLALSLIDHHAAGGETHRRPAEKDARAWPTGVQSPVQIVAAADARVLRLETAWLKDRPVYKLTNDERSWLVDAANGKSVTIDRPMAQALAAADYVGDAKATEPEWLTEVPREAIEHKAPLWRVRFADDVDTTLYVSAIDGRVLERRNVQSRWFDVFWMLHTMDYSGHGKFNHPLVIISAAGGLFAALTGVWLLVALLRRRPRQVATDK
jgi:hypothetical protein